MNRFRHGKPARCVSHDGTMQSQFPATRDSFPFVYQMGGSAPPISRAPVEPPPKIVTLGGYLAGSVPESERRLIARLVGDRRGAVMIEAALALPLLVTLIMGGLFYGIAVIAVNQLQFACESAALCGGYGQCLTASATRGYASDRVGGNGAYTPTFTVNMNATCTGGQNGQGVQVSGTMSYQLITMFPALTLSASACAPTMPSQLPS